MISKFVERIKNVLRDPSRGFKERVFILLTMITVAVAILAIIGDILVGENMVEIVALIVTVIIVPIITLVSLKRNRVMLALRLNVFGVVIFLLPILFYSGGGLMGGGFIWIIFAYLYTGLVLTGIWKPLLLIILTTETCGFFLHAYFHPEYITQHTRETGYVDIMISVILVGIVCCLMVWFEEWLFREENKRAREETKKSEELNKSQNRFFSSMSHEIRTPINSILGLNEIILRQEDASEEIIKDARNIEGAGKMLLSLINDILDMSKIEAGKMDIVPINYSLASMISEIVNMMWLRAQQKGLKFNIEIDPSIPTELFGDEVRIKQILVNLLNNAVKYTKEGSVTLRIEKEESRGEDVLLMFSVIDTGMGIKQDVIPYLFDAFQRVDEEQNAKIEGTGLGLSIVKQLVDLMDGNITVNSVYTEGSTFIVTLWQRVTRKEAIGNIDFQNYEKVQSRSGYVPGFKAPEARILIVDDNEMNLEVERKLLDGTEVIIDTADSGRQALYLTSAERYDCIFMDHLMPEMDGIECMQAIRKQVGGFNNHTPIIVLTANADSENRDLYNRSGFDGYLVKPVSGVQLEEVLLDHLPEVKVEMSQGTDLTKVQMNSSRSYSKKIPIVIATSTMCDLPTKVLREHQIDVIPFSVTSGGRTYYDLLEANTDEVMRYVQEGADYNSAPPTVEDFEKFFGKEVKKAHQVIYISVSTYISEEYKHAYEAARAFGNVWVFDSTFNSSAIGMLVLLAQRMAAQGRSVEKIIEELGGIRDKTRCSFVTGDSEFIMKRGGISKTTYGIISTFGLRPVINIKDGRITPSRVFMGDMEDSYFKYLDYALPRRAKPDLDVAIIDYIDLSDELKEAIVEHIRKRFNFEHIIFQKVSSVMSLNCGRGAMGIMYIMKKDEPYSLSQMLASVLHAQEEENGEEPQESANDFRQESDELREKELTYEQPQEPPQEPLKEPEWYETIPGIDPVKAIENSGSEDSFKAVLKIFYNSIPDRSNEIEDYYNTEDWENYTIKVHALKSSARLVGAMELSENARALEDAGKSGNIDYIKEHTEKLLADFRSYKGLLSDFFEKPEEEAPKEEQVKPQPVQNYDRFIIDSVYCTLKDAASKQDDKVIERTLKEILDYSFPPEDVERLEKIKAAFGEKDYDEIIKLSGEL